MKNFHWQKLIGFNEIESINHHFCKFDMQQPAHLTNNLFGWQGLNIEYYETGTDKQTEWVLNLIASARWSELELDPQKCKLAPTLHILLLWLIGKILLLLGLILWTENSLSYFIESLLIYMRKGERIIHFCAHYIFNSFCVWLQQGTSKGTLWIRFTHPKVLQAANNGRMTDGNNTTMYYLPRLSY